MVLPSEVVPPALGHWRSRSGVAWRTSMNTAETLYGVFAGHWRNFHAPGNLPLNSAEETALADGKRLFINWKPYPSGQNWAYTAAGSYDATLTSVAQDIENAIDTHALAPDDVWITFAHEPWDNLDNTVGSGWTATNYRDMWAKIGTAFTSVGVRTKCRFVWTIAHNESPHQADIPSLWPGDTLVDIVAQDPYIGPNGTPSDLPAKMISRVQWFRDNEDATHHWGPQSRPQVFAEYGADLNGPTGTEQHRADTIAAVQTNLSTLGGLNVVEMCFFDAGFGPISDPPAVDGAAYLALKQATE